MEEEIQFTINGTPRKITVNGDRALLWVLRNELCLTGTKYGCGEGICGACTVLINDEAVRSCNMSIRGIRGKQVVTIEGLNADALTPVQQAIVDEGATHCMLSTGTLAHCATSRI